MKKIICLISALLLCMSMFIPAMATENELKVVRDFIRENLGKEILATYDSMWIRNDPERAMIIADVEMEIKEEEPVQVP